MNSRPVIALAVIVAAVVGAAIWFLNSAPPAPPPDTVVAAVPATPEPGVATEPAAAPLPRPLAEMPAAAQVPSGITESDRKIDEILRANPDNSEAANIGTAQMLINLLPTLPAEGQAEAAQHISNLLPDKQYNLVLPILKNPAAPEQVLDVFVTDLMNRDDSVKLPALLDIAKIPNHPNREEAMTDLQIFLDGDFGTDWAKWDSSLKAYLAKQQAEAAAAAAIAPPK